MMGFTVFIGARFSIYETEIQGIPGDHTYTDYKSFTVQHCLLIDAGCLGWDVRLVCGTVEIR
jgi:hypothetical protein